MPDCLFQVSQRFYYVRGVNLLVYYTLLITAFAIRDCATSQASSLWLSSLFSVRVHVLKKVIASDLIDKNGIHLGVVSLYRYRLFTSHSTLANSINLFIVLISTYFTSLSLITKKVTCQWVLPWSAYGGILTLYTNCIMLYVF